MVYRGKGKNIWMLCYYAPINGKMTQIKETSGTSDEKTARNILRDKVAAVRVARKTGGSVELPANRKITVAELLDAYLEDLEFRQTKGADGARYQMGPESFLREQLGHLPIAALTHERMVGYVKARQTSRMKGKSNATVNHDLECLRAAVRLARRTGRITEAQMPVFPARLETKRRKGFFSSEEVELLCRHAPSWLAEMVRFSFNTGWRRGELLAMEWSWLHDQEITLPEEYSKNGERRVIPIAGELTAVIERLRAARTITKPDGSTFLADRVFHADGKPITRKRFVRGWNATRKAAGLLQRANGEPVLFHDFRRSAARRMTRAGVPQVVVMAVTGHKTDSMFRRYSIVATGDMADAFSAVSGAKDKAEGGRVVKMRRKPGA
jgi:integrase